MIVLDFGKSAEEAIANAMLYGDRSALVTLSNTACRSA